MSSTTHILKQQILMRPTMSLEVTLHITQVNPSQTNMFKEDSFHPKQTIWLHSHNNSHHLRKAVKRTPSSMDQDMTEKGVPKSVLQDQQIRCHKDQPLQHPQHKLEDHYRLPQSTIQTETTRIHQNAMTPPMYPPEPLQMAKAQELLNQGRRHQNLAMELWQVQVLLTSLLTHQRTLLYVQDVAKVATGAEIVHIIISVIFVE